MKNETSSVETATVEAVHPMHKSYTIISKGHVDLNNLSAFEAVSMTAVFLMAVAFGVLQSSVLFS